MRRQVRNYRQYVKREIQNQSSLRHPLIVSLREARRPTDCHCAWRSGFAQAVMYQGRALHAQPTFPSAGDYSALETQPCKEAA